MQNTVKIHYDITVRGRVQGVGFRYSAVNIAAKYGIKGFVKNLPDGNVQLEIEGNQLATDLMIKWCNSGPGTARVSEVFVSKGRFMNYQSFKIAY